jgi:hypothetical protein
MEDEQEILRKLSANEIRLGESISALTNTYLSLETRVKALEAKEQANEIIRAREDERDKALHRQLDELKENIKGMRGVGTQLLWIIGSAITVGIVGFILKGGLA